MAQKFKQRTVFLKKKNINLMQFFERKMYYNNFKL